MGSADPARSQNAGRVELHDRGRTVVGDLRLFIGRLAAEQREGRGAIFELQDQLPLLDTSDLPTLELVANA